MRSLLATVATLGLLLAACGQTSQLPTSTRVLIGDKLSYNQRLYKLTGLLLKQELGPKVGFASYHGPISGGFNIYKVRVNGRIVPNELAFEVASSSPKIFLKGVARPVNRDLWRIGPYTVRFLQLPKNFFQQSNREYIEGTTLLTISASSPYAVTYRSLVSKKKGQTVLGTCQNPPYWQPNSSLPWLEAPLICEQETAPSILYLIGNGGISVSSFQLPARPPSADEYAFWGLGFQGPEFQQILWQIASSEMGGLVGSGLLNLQTGQELPAPAALQSALFVSPNGGLYGLDGKTLEKWTGSALQPIGTLPDPNVEAVSDDGAAWASAMPSGSSPSAPTQLIRETAGSKAVQSWTVHGRVLGYGPGYIAWVGQTMRIMFPLQHRTLSFQAPLGQPLIYGQTNGELLTEIIYPTAAGGAAVIEISTKPTFPLRH